MGCSIGLGNAHWSVAVFGVAGAGGGAERRAVVGFDGAVVVVRVAVGVVVVGGVLVRYSVAVAVAVVVGEVVGEVAVPGVLAVAVSAEVPRLVRYSAGVVVADDVAPGFEGWALVAVVVVVLSE